MKSIVLGDSFNTITQKTRQEDEVPGQNEQHKMSLSKRKECKNLKAS